MLRQFALSLGLAAAAITPALAEYPERPVQIVIPYGPGGATDLSARALATALGSQSEQPFVLVNRTGAGGATGSAAVANAKPDGYTVLAARVGSHTVNPAMKANLPYKLDDFRFVGVYEINPVVCAVSADSDIESMEDLIEKVKEDPGAVRYSTSGVGSMLQIAAAMVLDAFGVENVREVTHLPLAGDGEAALAVYQGTATFICTNSSPLASFVKNGQLKPILVTTSEPVEGFDAPSAASLGHEDLEALVGWTGIAGPAEMPDEAAEKWRAWLAEAVKDETFLNFMHQVGSQVDLMSPEESLQFVNKQYETFSRLVEELGLRVE
jgi:tripartite-type tricarboxylate transporter receptor subunit TctC